MKLIQTVNDIDIEKWKYARKKPIMIRVAELDERIYIETREGTLIGEIGDFLAEGIEGELYPIGKDIFKKTYDIV